MNLDFKQISSCEADHFARALNNLNIQRKLTYEDVINYGLLAKSAATRSSK
jgi:hypothetical protein